MPLPVQLTRPCPGGNQGQNARGWCAPIWMQVDTAAVTPGGVTWNSYFHIECKFCRHTFPTPAGWVPPQPALFQPWRGQQ